MFEHGIVLFVLGSLLGFALAALVAGKTAGEDGLIPSLVFYFNGFNFHLHHWLLAFLLLFILLAVNKFKPFFKKYPAFYLVEGMLIGLIIQGMMYNDWYKIVYLN